MPPDADRHDEAIPEAWPFDPLLLIAVLCKGGRGGRELFTVRDIRRLDMRHSAVEEATPGQPQHRVGGSRGAAAGKVKLSSLQHLALTSLASQPDWCEAVEIGTAAVVIGRLRANGLVDRLPADRLRTHRQRYRINAAGIAALGGWTPPRRPPLRKRRQSGRNAIGSSPRTAALAAEYRYR